MKPSGNCSRSVSKYIRIGWRTGSSGRARRESCLSKSTAGRWQRLLSLTAAEWRCAPKRACRQKCCQLKSASSCAPFPQCRPKHPGDLARAGYSATGASRGDKSRTSGTFAASPESRTWGSTMHPRGQLDPVLLPLPPIYTWLKFTIGALRVPEDPTRSLLRICGSKNPAH